MVRGEGKFEARPYPIERHFAVGYDTKYWPQYSESSAVCALQGCHMLFHSS